MLHTYRERVRIYVLKAVALITVCVRAEWNANAAASALKGMPARSTSPFRRLSKLQAALQPISGIKNVV